MDVIVNGTAVGRARTLSGPTPELAGLDCPHAMLAGFALVVEDPGGGASPSAVEAVVRLLDGAEHHLGPVAVEPRQPQAPPVDVAVLQARAEQRAAAVVEPEPPALRLLALTHSLAIGGGQLYLLDLLRALVEEPDLSCVLVAPRDGPLRPILEALGITVHLTGEYAVQDPAAYESKISDLIGLARYHQSNLVVANTMGCALGPDLAYRLGLPSVWAIHESFAPPVFWPEAYGPEGYHPYVRDRGLQAIGTANALVFECHATKELFERYTDNERLVTWPYGIGLSEIEAYRRSHGERRIPSLADQTVRFLVVGTFEPRKAQSRTVIAFAQIADEYPGARLTMVGLGDDDYSRSVQDIVDRLGLDDRVELLPVASDLYEWYATADALVSASDIESLPRSVLEAMAFDLPVLATAVFGLPEVISDGVDGLLIEPGDTTALAGGLRRFLELDPAGRAAIGRAGGQRVRAAFAEAGWARPWIHLLRQLARDPQATPGRGSRP